jgi:DNA-binding transcriptional ArsR family regulator
MTEQREGLAFRRAVEQAGFARLSHLVVTDQNLSDGAVRLYARLLYYARQDIRCWPGVARLASDLGKSERTVAYRIEELEERGLITREQRGKGKTAFTWIEDLEDVYAGKPVDNSSPAKNCRASPAKNCRALALQKIADKEETEEETDMNGGGDNTKDIQTKTATLTAFGVAGCVAERLARKRSIEEIKGWLEYAARANGLNNPVAFVVARLRDGEPVPDQKKGNGQERRPDSEGKYAKYIQT